MEKISISRSNTIRGLAILAVMLLHFFPYLRGIYHGEYQTFFVFMDQLARFCVPAFLILSGYGLALTYKTKKSSYLRFIVDRIGKLFPLYVLWSVASVFIISSIPQWSFGNQPGSILIQLIFGQADYQLYFLPMLFQLYFLFPPLLWFVTKKPKLAVVSAFMVQLLLYIVYASQISNSDRFEYVLAFSWIGYFVLGIYLTVGNIPKLIKRTAPALTVIFLGLVTFIGVKKINDGIDPLPVLKFTKIILVPYIVFACISLFSFSSKKIPTSAHKIGTLVARGLQWFGRNSYVIFLSHTIAFRIIYAILHNQLAPLVLVLTIFLWIALVLLSHNILNTKLLFFQKKSHS